MIKLYHTNCPQCKTAELLLKKNNIDYEECTDMEEMIKLGFKAAPVLQVDNKFYQGAKNILTWLNNKK